MDNFFVKRKSGTGSDRRHPSPCSEQADRCSSAEAAFTASKDAILAGTASELLSAIKAVLSGYNYFPSQAIKNNQTTDSDLQLFRQVNDRELMVLQLFAQGRSNKEIAKGMFLSSKTVSTYKKRLMHKLQVNTLVDLIENVCFCASDDSEADSWDTQHEHFLRDARELAARVLLGEDEAIAARIRDTLAGILWVIPKDRQVAITVAPGTAINVQLSACQPVG